MKLSLSLLRAGLLCVIAASAPALAQAPDIATLQRKALAGNAEAQYQLAGDYFNGTQGIPKDPKQGLVWLRKSADQGYAWAEKALGVMYLAGEQNIPADPHEAAVWFRRAARQQNKPAQDKLSEMLANGVISQKEATWRDPQLPTAARMAQTAAPKPFSLAEVEKGLQGGIACKRLAALMDKFKVDFTLTADVRQRLEKEGADHRLLTTISASKRSL